MDENLTKTESNGNRATAQVRQMPRPKTLRTLTGTEALEMWAQVADRGGLKGAFPMSLCGGSPDGSEFDVFWHVERFWRMPNCMQFRAVALRIECEGRDPTMHELPLYKMFTTRYRRWYRKHRVKIWD